MFSGEGGHFGRHELTCRGCLARWSIIRTDRELGDEGGVRRNRRKLSRVPKMAIQVGNRMIGKSQDLHPLQSSPSEDFVVV